MKNYEIVSLDAQNMVEARGGKVIKLQPASRTNMANKAVAVQHAQVAEEIKEAAVGPKAKVIPFVIDGELGEGQTPKKIKLNGATLGKISGKGDVTVKGAEPVAEAAPVVEETPAPVEAPQAEESIPDYELPNFNFEALKFGEPTSEPEDEKEVKGNLSDIHIPGFEDKKEEPEPVAEEPEPVVEEKKEEQAPVAEPVVEATPEVEETKAEEETPAPVEEPKAEEKKEEVKDSPDELAAQLKSAIDKQIEKATKEAEEKAKKNAEKEIEKAKAEAEKAKAEAVKAQEELEKTSVDLNKALKDLEAAKTENKSLAQEVSDANRYKEAVAQVIGEIGAPEVEATRQRAA